MARNRRGRGGGAYLNEIVRCKCDVCIQVNPRGQMITLRKRKQHERGEGTTTGISESLQPSAKVPFEKTKRFKERQAISSTTAFSPDLSSQATTSGGEPSSSHGQESHFQPLAHLPAGVLQTNQGSPSSDPTSTRKHAASPLDVSDPDTRLPKGDLNEDTPMDIDPESYDDQPSIANAAQSTHSESGNSMASNCSSSLQPAHPGDEHSVHTPQTPFTAFCDSSIVWYWRLILLTVSWLHLHFHLSHAGCNLILKIIRLIFVTLGILRSDNPVPITLKSALKILKLEDDFNIHPVCPNPNCRHVFPWDTSLTQCHRCNSNLFSDNTSNSTPSSTSEPNRESACPSSTASSKPRKPILQCPQRPISDSILRFLAHEGNMSACEEWRFRKENPGVRSSIQDGEVWKDLKGPDGKAFFDNSPNRENAEELRIGVTLGFDGYIWKNLPA
ncbi:hypothetical protein K474DRAFT_1701852 [Panus rudis PR-1116 ss-1]|nr:hypothetical protein K474DRAFT_1701852 [Panus rudis PR-1116 ss-1]